MEAVEGELGVEGEGFGADDGGAQDGDGGGVGGVLGFPFFAVCGDHLVREFGRGGDGGWDFWVVSG